MPERDGRITNQEVLGKTTSFITDAVCPARPGVERAVRKSEKGETVVELAFGETGSKVTLTIDNNHPDGGTFAVDTPLTKKGIPIGRGAYPALAGELARIGLKAMAMEMTKPGRGSEGVVTLGDNRSWGIKLLMEDDRVLVLEPRPNLDKVANSHFDVGQWHILRR